LEEGVIFSRGRKPITIMDTEESDVGVGTNGEATTDKTATNQQQTTTKPQQPGTQPTTANRDKLWGIYPGKNRQQQPG